MSSIWAHIDASEVREIAKEAVRLAYRTLGNTATEQSIEDLAKEYMPSLSPHPYCIIIKWEWESESLTNRIVREEDNKILDELKRNSYEDGVIGIESET